MPTISCIGTRLPRICQGPVMPGVRCRRLRSSPRTCTSSSSTSGRGPTRLISPRMTLNSCGNSSSEVRRKSLPDGRDARVVGDLEQSVAGLVERSQLVLAGVGVRDHRAKLDDLEVFPVPANSSLLEEDEPSRFDANRERDRSQNRAEKDDPSAANAESNARFRRREDRASPNHLHPNTVKPSTSSNSTAEPTTSNIRGRMLTLTPTALAARMSSTVSPASLVVGAMMIR